MKMRWEFRIALHRQRNAEFGLELWNNYGKGKFDWNGMREGGTVFKREGRL
jgi:hypothetical protein